MASYFSPPLCFDSREPRCMSEELIPYFNSVPHTEWLHRGKLHPQISCVDSTGGRFSALYWCFELSAVFYISHVPLWCWAIQMWCTERLSISDHCPGLHFIGTRVLDVVLYPEDSRAHGVRWAHQVPAQMHALWFLGNPGCGVEPANSDCPEHAWFGTVPVIGLALA